jgi:putative transcriptional regulator
MAMRKKRSKILEAVHASARGLYAANAIDQVTMRHFDRLCLAPVRPLRPAEIRRIRESANVSQAVFAAVLNTSVSSVQKWEIGQKRPTGAALKLLHLVQKKGLDAVA